MEKCDGITIPFDRTHPWVIDHLHPKLLSGHLKMGQLQRQ